MKIGDTTQQQRNVVQKIREHSIQSKKSNAMVPAIVSLVVLAATLIFVFSVIGEKSGFITSSANLPDSITMINSSSGEIVELDYFEYSGFLDYITENNYGKQEDVLSTLKYTPIKNKHSSSSSYLVTFDCGKTVCASAYLTLESQTSTLAPLGEGILTSEITYSPNQENVMFLLSDSEKTKQRIVIINLGFNGESRIPSLHHKYFSNYNLPITNVQWLTDKKIKVTVADLEESTDEVIKKWEQDINRPTKTIEVPLPID